MFETPIDRAKSKSEQINKLYNTICIIQFAVYYVSRSALEISQKSWKHKGHDTVYPLGEKSDPTVTAYRR